MDTYRFEQDTITYNQGIFATALIAAEKLGLEIEKEQIEKGINAYRSLTHPSGRLQLSAKLAYHDISSLLGNFIAHRIFGVNILDSQTVVSTVQSQPKYDKCNMHVVANEQGKAIPALEFSRPYDQGDYQRGAEWPLYTVIAQEEAERNGSGHDSIFWQEKLQLMIQNQNAESMRLYKSGISFDPSRINHAWNATAYAITKEIIGTDNYYSIISAGKPSLVSEASQMQNSTL
jgi:hypothetical protein